MIEKCISMFISRGREDGNEEEQAGLSRQVFCLMKRREADSAAVIYLGVRMEDG